MYHWIHWLYLSIFPWHRLVINHQTSSTNNPNQCLHNFYINKRVSSQLRPTQGSPTRWASGTTTSGRPTRSLLLMATYWRLSTSKRIQMCFNKAQYLSSMAKAMMPRQNGSTRQIPLKSPSPCFLRIWATMSGSETIEAPSIARTTQLLMPLEAPQRSTGPSPGLTWAKMTKPISRRSSNWLIKTKLRTLATPRALFRCITRWLTMRKAGTTKTCTESSILPLALSLIIFLRGTNWCMIPLLPRSVKTAFTQWMDLIGKRRNNKSLKSTESKFIRLSWQSTQLRKLSRSRRSSTGFKTGSRIVSMNGRSIGSTIGRLLKSMFRR